MSDRGPSSNQSWLPLAFAAAAAAVGLGAIATLTYQSNQSTNRTNVRRRSRAEPFSARRLSGAFTAPADQTVAPAVIQSASQSAEHVNVSDFFDHLLSYISSASGKVLLLGGYLILDAKYSGWVISMSARFYTYLTVLKPIDQLTSQSSEQSGDRAIELLSSYNESCHSQWKLPSSIETYRHYCHGYNQLANATDNRFHCVFIVYSPQRSTRLSEYWLTLTRPVDGQYPCPVDSLTSISQSIVHSNDQSQEIERNPFVETCLYTVIHALSSILSFDHLMERLKYPVFVHLEADHPFYSAQPIDQSLNQPINPNLKTGLGSSAALVSSLTGALFECLGMNDQSITRSCTWLPLPSHLINDPYIHQPPTSMNDSFAFIHDDLTLTSASPDMTASMNQLPQANQSTNQQINPSFVPLSLTKSNIRELCHSLAQLCHCVAQGKVGSGFDVAAAFYGSSIYQRFDAAIYQSINQAISSFSVPRFELVKCLLPVISHEQHEARTNIDSSIKHSIDHSVGSLDSDSSLDSSDSESPVNRSASQFCPLCQCLRDRIVWNHSNHSISLPKSINLSLADVQGGASTPTMVKQVMKWQNENRQAADHLMDSINEVNQSIVNVVKEMCAIEEHSDEHLIGELNTLMSRLVSTLNSQWHSLVDQSSDSSINQYLTHLLSLVKSFTSVRAMYRELGESSGAAIVPDSQLALCESIEQQPGVVAAGLPGAGGEDAIFVLSISQTISQSSSQSNKFQLPSWSRSLPSNVHVLPVTQLDRPMTSETQVGSFSAKRIFT